MAAGTTFALRGHAYLDRAMTDGARTFTVTRVIHFAHNNLSAELRSAIAQALGDDATLRFADEPRDGLAASATVAESAPRAGKENAGRTASRMHAARKSSASAGTHARNRRHDRKAETDVAAVISKPLRP